MYIRPLALAIALPVSALPAGAWAFGGGPYPITEFALEASRQTSTWRFDGAQERIRTEKLGVRWHEALGDRLSGGAELGYLYLRPASGLDPSGNYIGFSLRYHALARDAFGVNLVAAYRYLHASDEHEGERLRVTAHRAQAGIEGAWRVAESLRLGVGSTWIHLEGEERRRGTEDQRRDVRNANRFVHRISGEVLTYGPGAIGLEYRTGAEDGWRLYAHRSF